MEWRLTPGRVRCEEGSVLVVHDQPDFKVFEIDLDSKYPGQPSYSVSDTDAAFMIFPIARTLNINEQSDTITTFELFPDHTEDMREWEYMTEAARYTWRIVMWRRPRN